MAKGLEILKDGLTLDGKPFYLASGDFHYFRTFKDGWGGRLDLMKDFGLNTVQVYVPWNSHEPFKGQFDFSGNLDVASFLQACKDRGLYVLFRPSPYICAEWEFGGLPYWLKKDRTICLRSSDDKFLAHVKDYYTRLSKEFLPYLYTNGGPIIAIAIENEYGSFGDDNDYLLALADILTDLGVDVPYFACGGWENFKLKQNSSTKFWTTLDLHRLHDDAVKNLKEYQPDKPIMISEFWAGESMKWGVNHEVRPTELVVDLYKEALYKDAYVNFYMFCGGTNFGFTNGANELRQSTSFDDETVIYAPFVTSYDTSAPVNEYGHPTEKYFELKKVLKSYLDSKNIPFTGTNDFTYKKATNIQVIPDVTLTESADFLSNVDNLTVKTVKSGKPVFMEDVDQATGFIMYSSTIKKTDEQKRMLKIKGVRDRATVYVDGEYKGTFLRDMASKPLAFDVVDGSRLDILVENLGSVNYGVTMLDELKGISGYVRLELIEPDNTLYPWNYTMKSCWVNKSIPLTDISKIDYTKKVKIGCPAFYRGKFKAQVGKDALIDTKGLTKGNIFINGFNIGRYWEIGPQRTLYVPKELLKEENEIVIFELHSVSDNVTVSFADKELFCEPTKQIVKNSKVED